MFSHFDSMFPEALRAAVRCKPRWLELVSGVKTYAAEHWIFTVGYDT